MFKMSLKIDAIGHRSYSLSGDVKRSVVPGLPSRHASYSSTSSYRLNCHRMSTSSSAHQQSHLTGAQQQQGTSESLIELETIESKSGGLDSGQASVNRFSLPPASLMKSLESTTSSSLLHGIILICIMISSLISFVLSLLTDICEEAYIINCSSNALVAYSLASMTSCLFCFVIYFLHLIGQCDYVSWSAKRKILAEITGTCFVLILVTSCVTCVMIFTPAINFSSSTMYLSLSSKSPGSEHSSSAVKNGSGSPSSGQNGNNSHQAIHSHSSTVQAAVISSFVSILCYILRILSLVRESRMLASKPSPARASQSNQRGSSFKVTESVVELAGRLTNSIRSFTSAKNSAERPSNASGEE